MIKNIVPVVLLVVLSLLATRCAGPDEDKSDMAESAPSGIAFSPYTIEDSSAIVTYPSGLRLYVVQEGPGEFPRDGMNIFMNYHGMLKDGTVFDSSFQRGEPFTFTLAQTPIIEGLYQALQKLRLGSKAVVIVPPPLGYGSRKDRPSNIPENSTLFFHIDLLGTF